VSPRVSGRGAQAFPLRLPASGTRAEASVAACRPNLATWGATTRRRPFALTAQVEALERKHPVDYARKNATKRLAAIGKLAFASARRRSNVGASVDRGPRFIKMSKRVVYPMDEVLDFESQALRASTWESAGDVVPPNGSNLTDLREIAHVTGLPLHIFSPKQTQDSLGVPHRRVQKPIRFDRDEVMPWAWRWLQDAKDQGIDAKADPADQHLSLQQALASLPA
jgi:hypothetical protein